MIRLFVFLIVSFCWFLEMSGVYDVVDVFMILCRLIGLNGFCVVLLFWLRMLVMRFCMWLFVLVMILSCVGICFGRLLCLWSRFM